MRFEDRKREVLRDLIDEFLQTGAPVSSKSLAERSRERVSSATVRAVMADLTREGFLEQPHTSAGRVPSDRALRLYIDEVLESAALRPAERARLEGNLESVGESEARPMAVAARVLSDASRQAGLFLSETLDKTRLKRIEFIRLATRRVLVLLITTHGLVHERLLSTEEDYSSDELQRFSNFLNMFAEGSTLAEIRKRLDAERAHMGVTAGMLVSHAIALGTRALEDLPFEAELYVEGQANIAEDEELLRNSRQLRELLAMLEDRNRMAALLVRVARGEGVKVFLGEEAGLEGLPVSLIAAPCRLPGEDVVGTVGVIGSLRMNYQRVIPVVSFLADALARKYWGRDAGDSVGE